MSFSKRSCLALCGLGALLGGPLVACSDDAGTNGGGLPEPMVNDIIQPVGTDPSLDDPANPSATTGGTSAPGVVIQPSTIMTSNEPVFDDTQAGAMPMEQEACQSGSTPTSLQGVVLAFAFDVSGSMGSNTPFPYYSRELKWEPVVAATKAFFADPTSAGVLATLTFFPNEGANPGMGGGGGGGGGGLACNVAAYAEPDVPLTALPSDAFATAIDAITPATDNDWRGGTPTRPVVEGIIQMVQEMQAADTTNKYVVVLVSDGAPSTCMDNTVESVARVAQRVAADIPTYVIGVQNPDTPEIRAALEAQQPPGGGEVSVPDAVTNLNAIAVGGGTEQAFIINTEDPMKTAADFQAVIATIRESSFSCNLPIPEPPTGQQFDPAKVNVKYGNMMGETAFVYDETCTEPFAWHYDDAANPTVIEMCEKVCDDIRADYQNEGALNVEFGCVRRTGGPR